MFFIRKNLKKIIEFHIKNNTKKQNLINDLNILLKKTN